MRKIIILLLAMVAINSYSQNQYTIITYNIKYAGSDWNDRKDGVVSVPQFFKADIFCTQEVLNNQLKNILERNTNFNYVGVGRDDGEEDGEYSAIFFNKNKFECLENGNFWLAENTEKPNKGWDAAYIRICTWAMLKDNANNNTFFVFNTHFDNVGKVAQENSAKLILEKIKTLTKNAEIPVVLTGDFNMIPSEEPIKTIKNTLFDSYDVCETPRYGTDGTFNNFEFKPDVKERIDYVFLKKGIKVLRYGVLTNSKNNAFPSDHFPVLAEIVF